MQALTAMNQIEEQLEGIETQPPSVSNRNSYGGPAETSVEHGCFVVRVRARGEDAVGNTLRQKGFRVITPTYIERRRYSDRIKQVRSALFPGYIFVHLDARELLPVLSTEGVSYILKTGNTLVPLRAEEAAAFAALSTMDEVGEPCDQRDLAADFVPGQKVRISSGPLRGLEGLLLRSGNKNRLVVAINSIFSAASIDLRDTAVERL